MIGVVQKSHVQIVVVVLVGLVEVFVLSVVLICC